MRRSGLSTRATDNPRVHKVDGRQKGIDLDVSDEAYNSIVKGNFVAKQKKQHDMGIDTSKLERRRSSITRATRQRRSEGGKDRRKHGRARQDALLPRGGGQESDHGTINGIRSRRRRA